MSTETISPTDAPPVQVTGLLIRQEEVPGYLGISRAVFFRLRSMPGAFPSPVKIPGSGIVFRRTDLERWATTLKPDHKSRRRGAGNRQRRTEDDRIA